MSLSNRLALSSGGANGANTLLSLVWMLFCVLVIVVLAYLFTKYIAGRGSAAVIASGGTEQFRVLARLPLGREQSAALVKAGEKYLLLGVTSSEVTLLKELTQAEAESMMAAPPGQPSSPSFGEALRTVLKQKKPR